ncbi:MAG: MFS transporter [Pseudomonadota bacterium]|nr:MFS transporter [Pseudomonadota bacterium]
MNMSSTTRGKLILAAGVALFAIGQSLLFIIIAPLAPKTGLTEIQFGTIFGLANIPLIFTAPMWGKLSDTHGRKPIFIIGLFGSAIGTILVALALEYGLSGSSTVVTVAIYLFLARAFYSSTAAAIYPSSNAYIADITERSDRAQGMALIGGANSLGSMLGPAIGGGLAFVGLLFPMYVAAFVMTAGGIWAIFSLTEPKKHVSQNNKVNIKFTDKRLRPFMIAWGVFFLVFISLQFITAYYIRDVFGYTDPADQMRIASIALASMAIIITVVQGVIFQIFRPHPRTLLRLFGPSFVIALLIIALAPNIYLLIFGYSLIGISFAFGTPGINGGLSLCVEAHEQGTAAGILAAGGTIGPILGPALGPMLFSLSPTAPMLFGAVTFTFISFYMFSVKIPEA